MKEQIYQAIVRWFHEQDDFCGDEREMYDDAGNLRSTRGARIDGTFDLNSLAEALTKLVAPDKSSD
jgi:hypothetical protein